MIIMMVLWSVVSLIGFLLSPINLPNYPSEVQASLDFIANLVTGTNQFMGYWLSTPIYLFCVIAVVAAFNLQWVIGMAQFILSKIPWLNLRM